MDIDFNIGISIACVCIFIAFLTLIAGTCESIEEELELTGRSSESTVVENPVNNV